MRNIPNDKALDEIMNFKQACEFLGYGENTMRRMVAANEIPVHRIRKRLRFLKSELIEWVKEH